ncbi:MAG: YidC/Oxa1 family insertase periplasmic-domain containing protein [Planctomycetota bacterium]
MRIENWMRIFTAILLCFFLLCGWLVVESGLFDSVGSGCISKGCILLQKTAADERAWSENAQAPGGQSLKAGDLSDFRAVGGEPETVILGSQDPSIEDPADGFEFQLELSSKGAAIARATFSNGNDNGFDDRDPDDPQPLVLLSGVGQDVLSMAIREFVLVEQKRQLRLDQLSWKSLGVERGYDTETARFEVFINAPSGEPLLKLVKTYKVSIGSYLAECTLEVENRSAREQKVRFSLTGPVGVGREGVRSDMRKVVGGFRDSQGHVTSTRLGIKKLRKAASLDARRLVIPGTNFLWAAAVNKYFAAILVPLPQEGKAFCDWVIDKTGQFYNPDQDIEADSGDETVGLNMKVATSSLSAADQAGSSKTYNFQLYLGPKDKGLFDKNERYRELGFVQTIDFMACCCPSSIIRPLAFGILWLMKQMYGFVYNYGLVIIILVFLFRMVIHPLTKKSQISMSKMSKLGPKVEEIKKKYANNKVELNKHMMAVYREQGISPFIGMLPMFVQMPIWIALWSAIYTSIALRGAPFCLWITDLSVPDALFRFTPPIVVPLLKWKIVSFNLLPILMGVAFYLQQRLMPKQAAVNPQAAQQQKMMMIMMPLLFPLMLYNAPSGVNLYIMASTFAGVFEQYFIKKHIREKEEAESKGLVAATSKTGGKVKKRKPKPFYRTRF